MAKQTFTTGQVLTAAQMTSLQQTAMLGGAASAKTASYTLVAADAGTAISMSNAGATTITVNTALFAAGDTVQITNLGAGVCTITAGTATVNTSASLALAQYESGTLDFTSTSAAIFIKGAAGAAAGGGMTLLSTTAMSGTTTTVSSISQDYVNLYIFAPSITFSASAALRYKFNGSSYYFCEMATYSDAILRVTSPASIVAPQSALSATNWGLNVVVPSYTSALNKSSNADVLNANGAASFIEVYDTNAAAVTSFSITSAAGTATLSGNIYIYGVK
jgi:hypothetical protein